MTPSTNRPHAIVPRVLLDLGKAKLHLDAGTGRHLLMISDEANKHMRMQGLVEERGL